MKLNRTPNPLDRSARNGENDNWDIIEGEVRAVGDKVDNFVEEVSDAALDKVVDNAKLNWEEPVDNFNSLPSNAKNGDTRMSKDTGKVYRYDGNSWIEIQQIDAGPVNELDRRLSSQLAETGDKLDLKGWELNSKGRKPQGHLVFITDDAKRGDWDILRPIFLEMGVPLGVAVISNSISGGSHRYDPEELMTKEELLQWQNEYGWEIYSHSQRHDSPYITDLSYNDAYKEYENSRKDLIAEGFDVSMYMTPFGRFNAREREIARATYRAARVSTRGLNTIPIETHELKSEWISDNYNSGSNPSRPLSVYTNLIDEAVEKGGLAIISTHGDEVYHEDTQQMIRDIIDYAKSTSINISRLDEALDNIGNIIEIGDYTKTTTSGRESQRDYYVVGVDGNVVTSNTESTDYRTLNFKTKPRELPYGTTYSYIPASQSSESPSGTAGTLISENHFENPLFAREIFNVYKSSKSWVRYAVDEDNFSKWTEKDLITVGEDNEFSINDLPTDFYSGISSAPITAAYKDDTPSKTPGTLIHYDVSEVNRRFNSEEFREYQSRLKYSRYPLSDSEWSDFRLDTNLVLSDENSITINTPIADIDFGEFHKRIPTAHASTTPSGTAGMYRVVNTAPEDRNFAYSEFKPYKSNDLYRRYVDGGVWSPFVKVNG